MIKAVPDAVPIRTGVLEEFEEAVDVVRFLHKEGKFAGFSILIDPGKGKQAMIWSHWDDNYSLIGVLEYAKKTLMEL